MVIAGTEGYTESADSLIARYESVSFAEKYESVFHLMPEKTSDVLDIGAGTGADAAWFAAAGHQVLAVEPTDSLRDSAKAIHPSPLIEWVADSLPDLRKLISLGQSFDLVLLTAVWMHLVQQERQRQCPMSQHCSRQMELCSCRFGMGLFQKIGECSKYQPTKQSCLPNEKV